MGISTPGVGSNLPVQEMVSAIVNAEITPLQKQLDKRVNSVNTEISAVGQLKSSLMALKSALANLADLGKLYKAQATVSDTDYLTASVGAQPSKGNYQIQVEKLAQTQSLASAAFANTTSSVGNGTMTITLGSYNDAKTTFTANTEVSPINVVISPGNDNLAAIKDAINNTKSGLNASIVQDSQGYRLTIVSKQTGQQYAMKISGGVTALNYDPTAGVNQMTETMKAQDSQVVINGLTLTQSSNQLDKAISGVTINLNKADAAKTINLTVGDNSAQVTSNVNDFIKKYNDTMTLLTNLTGYNATTKNGGIFQGDPQFRTLKTNLSKMISSSVNVPDNKLKSLGMLGIKTGTDGMLSLDQTKFQDALKNNYDDIGKLFSKTALSTDTGIKVNKVGTGVKAGTYDVNLSTYVPGTSMTGTIGGLNATSSNGLTLNGSGDLAGISLNVISGSTGNRGSVTVYDGLAVKLDALIDSYTSITGDLKQRSDQLDRQLKQLSGQQANITTKSKQLTDRYFKQFSALDALLTKMQSLSTQLGQQIASLPDMKTKS